MELELNEYTEHKKKMYWTLRNIVEEKQFCSYCKKIIMKRVWSYRYYDSPIFCSSQCMDDEYYERSPPPYPVYYQET